MRADGVHATHNGTGGSGTITLVAQTGFPTPDLVWTGVRNIEYSIVEWTSSAKTQLAQLETGIGSIDTATLILTRTKVLTTWNGTVYRPLFGNATAPSALTISGTAANVDINIGPASHSGPSLIPFKTGAITNVSDGVGLPGAGPTPISSIFYSLASGTVFYYPVDIRHAGPFSQAAVRVTTATTGTNNGTISVAIYEVGTNGLPGKKLIDFGSLGNPGTAITLQNPAISIPVDIGIGYFWVGVLFLQNSSTGTPAIRASPAIVGPQGCLMAVSGGMTWVASIPAQSALNDPATAPTGNSNAGANAPLVTFL